MNLMKKFLLLVLPLSLILFLAGCSGANFGPKLLSIQVGPLPSFVAPGSKLQMLAIGTFDDHEQINISHEVTWRSSDNLTLTVDPNTGIATGVSDGTATVTATASALSGQVAVTVKDGVVQ